MYKWVKLKDLTNKERGQTTWMLSKCKKSCKSLYVKNVKIL